LLIKQAKNRKYSTLSILTNFDIKAQSFFSSYSFVA